VYSGVATFFLVRKICWKIPTGFGRLIKDLLKKKKKKKIPQIDAISNHPVHSFFCINLFNKKALHFFIEQIDFSSFDFWEMRVELS
jgi:hypothetical protein